MKIIPLTKHKYLFYILIVFSVFCHTSIAQPGDTTSATNSLPELFDLRDVNGLTYVTSVKHQQGGTCWTHAIMASIESNLLVTGEWFNVEEYWEPDLAEYHLDWWNGFNQYNNDDIYPAFGNGVVVHEGGDYLMAAAYISRGDGVVRDIDGQSFKSAPGRYDPSYHIYYVHDIEWYEMGSALQNIDEIKNAILTHGVVGTSLAWYGEFFDPGSLTFYQPLADTLDPNHAVAIVGWNDTLSTTAPNPGAWLCKNSWGSGWGDAGYFWISYYDKHCGRHIEMGAVSFQNVEFSRFDKIYYHDYHGWRDTMPECTEAFNAFTTTHPETLCAVSFYTATNDVTYNVRIYDSFNGTSLGNELATATGEFEFRGFHTVDLPEPVTLPTNDDFYIYVNLSDGGHAYDRTSYVNTLLGSTTDGFIVTSAAQPEESYYAGNGQWFDLYYYDDPRWPENGTSNFCIKGLCVTNSSPNNETDPDNPTDYQLYQNYPNPFNHVTKIKYDVPFTAKVTVTIFNIKGEEVITLVNTIEHAGEKETEWNGMDASGRMVSSGIYIYRLDIGGIIKQKKMTYVR